MEAEQLSSSDTEGFQLSLRVRHPSMDPAEISRAFKIEPEHSFRAGGPRAAGGVANAAVHSESYWLGMLGSMSDVADYLLFPTGQKPHIAEKQLALLRRSLSFALSLRASRFFSTHAELLRRIRSEGGNVTLLVTIYDGEVGSFTLAPEASRIFGDLGIAVEFELEAGE
jgi:hypothetical protein